MFFTGTKGLVDKKAYNNVIQQPLRDTHIQMIYTTKYSLITNVVFQRSENLKSIPRIQIQAEAESGGSSFLAPPFSRTAYTSVVFAFDRSIFYQKARAFEDPISLKSSVSGKSPVTYDKSYPYPIFTLSQLIEI